MSDDAENIQIYKVSLDSIDCKSKVWIYIRTKTIDLQKILQPSHAVLFVGASRKITHSIDIVTQMVYDESRVKVLGEVKDQLADFGYREITQYIAKIPQDRIIRHMLQICGIITQILFFRASFKCSRCGSYVVKPKTCQKGCINVAAKFKLEATCRLQDDTGSCFLKLDNQII